MSQLNSILGAFFIIAFIVLLVASNVRWAFNSLPLYELGFSRHSVVDATGLAQGQLSEVARQIRDYFNSSEELLDVLVNINGTKKALYSEREVLHMQDVKELISRIYRIQEGVFLYLLLFTTVGFFILGNAFAGRLGRLLTQGSLLIMVLAALVGLVSLARFGPLFLLFHRLSFSNDLWQLDPYTSYLLQMFPQGFWLDAMLLVGLATIVEAVAVLVLLAVLKWFRAWRQRVAQSKAPRFI